MAHYVMQKKGLDHLLVIDHEGRLAGTVSRKSLFNVMDENKSQGI
jgi:CBS domain-containing protein